MSEKAVDLFQAYTQGKLPKEEGAYVVSSFFSETSSYAIYEIVAYAGVKSIYLSEDGLTFQTDGNKLFILVEPDNYSKKHIEPFRRDSNEHIPHRFAELDIYIAKNQYKVMVSKKPIVTYSSFTILKPAGNNFALLFFNNSEVLKTLEYFFTQTLNKEAGVPKIDAKKAASGIIVGVKKFSIW